MKRRFLPVVFLLAASLGWMLPHGNVAVPLPGRGHSLGQARRMSWIALPGLGTGC